MRVLGIMDSHLSAAALLVDGRVVAAVREELLLRDKGFARFPRAAVQEVLALGGVEGPDIDAIAFGIRADRFDTPAFQAGERGLKRRGVALATRLLPGAVIRSRTVRDRWVDAVGALRRRHTLAEEAGFLGGLGLDPDAAIFVDHHRCHALTALLWDPAGRDAGGQPRDGLVVVCDGYGDGDAGGIWEARGGEWRQLARLPFVDSLGSVYSRVTRVLGMKPWEHEYKVMGLAPYGDHPRAHALLDGLRTVLRVDDGVLHNPRRLTGPFLEARLERLCRGHRFDHVAWALQRLTEELLCAWVQDWLQRTGHRRLGLAGGVFLNVKANQALGALPDVDELFVVPPAGDESASVGAAMAAWVDAVGIDAARRQASPLDGLFLGPAFTETQAEEALSGAGLRVSRPDDLEARAATVLEQGGVLARCVGRAEFGPRALGHRSILCRPDRLDLRERINRAIKHRDFWMPFAATVLDTHADRYLVNPKGHDGAWMIRTFDTTPLGREHLAAALHPGDGTTRPQLLRPAPDPDYHRTVAALAERTGLGAVLNTSFNLHGEPIVCTPQDAVRTFLNSGLDRLWLGPFWVEKAPAEADP